MILWVEYPLLPEHADQLPPGVIDGVCNNEGYLEPEKRLGIRQFNYASMQGVERFFPSYLAFVEEGGRHNPGRLADTRNRYLHGRVTRGNPIGAFAAAWDDSGLHNEIFWLGWCAMGQYGWLQAPVSVEQTTADFMDTFYGTSVAGMSDLYLGLQAAARFYERSWDKVPSKEREPAYGDWDGKRRTQRTDWTLKPPALPRLPDLKVRAGYRKRYAAILAEAPSCLAAVQRTLGGLQENLSRVSRNRYNLEVLLSIGQLLRHHAEMLLALAGAEDRLGKAARLHAADKHTDALEELERVHADVCAVVTDLRTVYAALKATWEVSRMEKGMSVGERDFVHIMDDVKDHRGDRRPDLSYLIAPEERIGLEAWCEKLAAIIEKYGDG